MKLTDTLLYLLIATSFLAMPAHAFAESSKCSSGAYTQHYDALDFGAVSMKMKPPISNSLTAAYYVIERVGVQLLEDLKEGANAKAGMRVTAANVESNCEVWSVKFKTTGPFIPSKTCVVRVNTGGEILGKGVVCAYNK